MVKLNIKFLPKQKEIYEHPARFKIIACFPKGEHVYAKEYIPIEQIVNGMSVMGEGESIVTKTFTRKYEGEIYNVFARYINPFKITPEHPLLIANINRNDNYEAMKAGRRNKKTLWSIADISWKSINDIKNKNFSDRYNKTCLCIPRITKYSPITEIKPEYIQKSHCERTYSVESLPLNEEIGYVLGWYIAEGYSSKNGIFYSLGGTELKEAQEIAEIYTKYGYRPKIKYDKNVIKIWICSSALGRTFLKLFGHKAPNKKIPHDLAFNTNEEFVKSMLRGLFYGDGYLNKKTGHFQFKTSSQNLAFGIQLICARFGYIVSVKKTKRKDNHIQGRLTNSKDFYRVESTSKSLLKDIYNFESGTTHREYGFITDNYIFVPITNIKSESFKGEVYNLQTTSETYTVSNIICHNCGRRFGKTFLCSYKVILSALSKPNQTFFILAPNYAQTKILWRMIKRTLPKEAVKRIMEGELFIELNNGSIIFAKSGDNPDALRGEGLDGCVLDECAMLRPEVWNEAIRPALADKNGWAIFISTPKGKNWFYELFLRGEDPNQVEFKSFQYPSWENPLLAQSEIEEMRKSMPEVSFRQEVMAEFLDAGGLVFRGLDKVLTSHPEEPKPGEFYVIGVDLGRHEDFTVIKVGNISTNKEVYRERFNQSDWDYIKDRIRNIYNKYNRGCIIMDSTGYGDPIYEDLSKEGLNINGINMNVSSKPKLIENLQLMIENQQISLINDPNLAVEFGAYTYTLLPSGNVRYEASQGFHDDEVISTALMALGMQGGGTQAIGVVEDIDTQKYGETIVDYDDLQQIIEWDELEEYEKTKAGRIL